MRFYRSSCREPPTGGGNEESNRLLYFANTLKGRKDDLIKISGYKVSSRKDEDLIYEIREVHEVAVIGIDDEILGNRMDAFVVKNNGTSITEQEMIDYCRKRIPVYMVPSTVKFLDHIPKNDSGKHVKSLLITK
jgi:long-chain acyl-CoA synthetase